MSALSHPLSSFEKLLDAADRVTYRVHGRVLVVLSEDILAKGSAIRFIPLLPILVAKPGLAANFGGKHVCLGDVRKVPVELVGQIKPVVAGQHGNSGSDDAVAKTEDRT